jgi:hypothetical protein
MMMLLLLLLRLRGDAVGVVLVDDHTKKKCDVCGSYLASIYGMKDGFGLLLFNADLCRVLWSAIVFARSHNEPIEKSWQADVGNGTPP